MNTIYATIPVTAIKTDDNGKRIINWMVLRVADTDLRIFPTKKAAKEAAEIYNNNINKIRYPRTPTIEVVKVQLNVPVGAHFKVFLVAEEAFRGFHEKVIGRFTDIKDAITVAQENGYNKTGYDCNVALVLPRKQLDVFDTIADWKKAKGKKVFIERKVQDEDIFWGNGNRVLNRGIVPDILEIV
jgi:hypothetical protein